MWEKYLTKGLGVVILCTMKYDLIDLAGELEDRPDCSHCADEGFVMEHFTDSLGDNTRLIDCPADGCSARDAYYEEDIREDFGYFGEAGMWD